VHPNAIDIADGIHNDGDGKVDEDSYDLDGDGYSIADGDLNDGDAQTYPGAPELADGIDN
jgi:hypothetical protein